MPKLRNASTEIGGFVQWMLRKCRNHNPLHELQMTVAQRGKLPGQHKQGTNKGEVFARTDREDVAYYMAGNRAFEISVKEVDPEDVDKKMLVAAGF